ncbi:NUDIX domain-containing protein [Paracoccus aestuariivivens]|uniref:ADP-ribose pyrophosphatase n=1 Tax=Paracoccus aestuariivivens TaxID=1820333 RepID=A0A6L6JC68_9RHOB|nr:NUDIX domain-containing protein [Paracoccus aestuariivivens]MTH78738.1 NUDIX domain-containing protein [Paracoccus aestuariivivens]
MPLLIGALAHPLLRMRLAPEAVKAAPLNGKLQGGAMAGLKLAGFPGLIPGEGHIPAWDSPWTDELRRYARIFGLTPRDIDGRDVLGLDDDLGHGAWQPELAAAMADWVLDRLRDKPPEAIRPRLPMIAGWIASRMRAEAETRHLPKLGPSGDDRVRHAAWDEPYGDYFSVESHVLHQRRHRGDWSPDMRRAVFVSGDATVVLPWDPVRDRVMLIDQFRAGPVARGDAQPWLYETVAGRVDAGETPEQAALREGIEEAGLAISRLIPGPQNYPSPGMLAEYLYLFIGIADLPDDAAGFGGLEIEDEDIRSHVVARSELTRIALAGELRNGPLLTLALWFELNIDRIRAELDDSPTA